ncbi:MAG: hypothetical protein M3O41_18570 [Pseudomonadota bacterium]|nr:hypothetical protein [Pseudomonadota bacterium]
MAKMIPIIRSDGSLPRSHAPARAWWVALLTCVAVYAAVAGAAERRGGAAPLGSPTPARTAAPAQLAAAGCLPSGDGYLRARIAGAIDAKIDWPNSGTRCQGESKSAPPGVRLSFQRDSHSKPDLLFVFGLTGIREGQPARAAATNLTIIVQGTDKIFGTLGDSRCTVDSLSQQPLQPDHMFRVEARGFCTQPAHAVRGNEVVLVSTFEFAGLVSYESDDPADGGDGQPGGGQPSAPPPATR